MRNSLLIALLLVAALMGATAGRSEDTTNGWITWELTSEGGKADHVAGWELAFHSDGRVSTSWMGPMYASEAGDELATLEVLEAIGSYRRADETIVFTNADVGDGWLWRWQKVTCRVTETSTELVLSNCLGTDRPDWADQDPAQPADMTFKRAP
jgi:hypothetical protein